MFKMKKETSCDEPISQKKVIHDKPKIMLIDMPDEATETLIDEGYNIVKGTFGKPYKVNINSGFQPVISKASLPNYSEQEIIIIQLTPPESIEQPEGERTNPDSEPDIWTKCNKGIIDPRPRIMSMIQNDFDRILNHGGLFVIFTEPRQYDEYVWAKVEYNRLSIENELNFDNWSFSSIFSRQNIEIEYNNGEEIKIPEYDLNIYKFLKSNINKAQYRATFKPTYRINDFWLPILFDKYSRTIGAIIKPDDTKGRILLLPQMKINKPMISSLLKEVLPEISPHLFPYIEGSKWVERDEYELLPIIEAKKEIDNIQKKAQQDIEVIENKITTEREKYSYLHGIITQTSDELVSSVKQALNVFGFSKILDVDEEIAKEDLKINKQEDLQIHDTSPTLLIEVKGLTSLPHESHTLQVIKYVSRRMKDWNRTDVRGVSIINHQRKLPSLDRDNINVFTEQQIDDAIENDITIVATWDLFLLLKGLIKLNWDKEKLKPIFYKKGKISRVPPFYKKIGIINHYYDRINIISITLSESELKKNDKIAYILPSDYLEEVVTSIEVNNEHVEFAESGSTVGIKTQFSKDILKTGLVVYIVET